MFPSFFVCGQRCQTFMTYSFAHVTAIFFALPACLPAWLTSLLSSRLSLSFLSFSPSESFLIKRANRIRVKLSMVEGATSACHTQKNDLCWWIARAECHYKCRTASHHFPKGKFIKLSTASQHNTPNSRFFPRQTWQKATAIRGCVGRWARGCSLAREIFYKIRFGCSRENKNKNKNTAYNMYIFVTQQSRSSPTIEMSNCQRFSSDWHQELGN